MTNKRSNGEGTIYKNEIRNRFEGQVTVGIKSDGKTIRRKVTGRTRAEVAKKMSEVRERCSHGPGLPSDVTVGDWLGYWVSSVLPSANFASATRESYDTLCARYLLPRLGRVRLVKLAPADVRAMNDPLFNVFARVGCDYPARREPARLKPGGCRYDVPGVLEITAGEQLLK